MKRVILANHSRLLSEVFRRALAKADQLEVVGEVVSEKELPLAIQRFCPEWVIVSLPVSNPVFEWLTSFLQRNSSVRFIFLSSERQRVTMNGHLVTEQDLSNLSLKEFIHLLEKDSQHI